jgi:hypothetical protein
MNMWNRVNHAHIVTGGIKERVVPVGTVNLITVILWWSGR